MGRYAPRARGSPRDSGREARPHVGGSPPRAWSLPGRVVTRKSDVSPEGQGQGEENLRGRVQPHPRVPESLHLGRVVPLTEPTGPGNPPPRLPVRRLPRRCVGSRGPPPRGQLPRQAQPRCSVTGHSSCPRGLGVRPTDRSGLRNGSEQPDLLCLFCSSQTWGF